MRAGEIAFALFALNPIGGLTVAIPFAVFKLHYAAWVAIVVGSPLSYVQVLVVDVAWSRLAAIPAWRRLLERSRSARVERLIAGRGAFWITATATPLLGAWLVMAFMRYANVPHRRVAAPILVGATTAACVVGLLCEIAPRMFHHGP